MILRTLKTACQTECHFWHSKRRYQNVILTLAKKKIKPLYDMAALIFPLHKSDAQVSLWREIMQRYNVCLQSVSFQDMHQRIHPNGRHTLWRCREHTAGNGNHAFPYGHNSYQAALTGRWTETFRHKQVSYLRNQNG